LETLRSLFEVRVALLRNVCRGFIRLFRNALEKIFEASGKLMTVVFESVNSSLGVRDGEKNEDSLNKGPSVVAGSNQDHKDDDGVPLHSQDSSLAVEVLRSELGATETHVTRDLTVSRRLSKVVSFSTLVLFHKGLDSSLGGLRKFGLTLGAGQRSRLARVTDIALVVVLSASASTAVNDSIKVLSVEAFFVWLSSDVSHLLTEVALVSSMSAIVRSPGLVVRFLSTRSIGSLTLRLMELSEINVDKSSLSLLITFFLLILLELIDTVHKELLGSASRLSDDVLHMDGVVGNFDSLPALSVIPCEF